MFRHTRLCGFAITEIYHFGIIRARLRILPIYARWPCLFFVWFVYFVVQPTTAQDREAATNLIRIS